LVLIRPGFDLDLPLWPDAGVDVDVDAVAAVAACEKGVEESVKAQRTETASVLLLFLESVMSVQCLQKENRRTAIKRHPAGVCVSGYSQAWQKRNSTIHRLSVRQNNLAGVAFRILKRRSI
jgi:hypothetical protein